MERQLVHSRLAPEQYAETCGNEPLQSNWGIIEETMHLYCNALHRPDDPYGRHGTVMVNYLGKIVGGVDTDPYGED